MPSFTLVFYVYVNGIICGAETGCTIGGSMIKHNTHDYDLVMLKPLNKGPQPLSEIESTCVVYSKRQCITYLSYMILIKLSIHFCIVIALSMPICMYTLQ